jgi:hypothetical protein
MNAQTLDLRALARALGGEVTGGQVLAPGPNHSDRDRSLAVRLSPDAPDGFVVHSYSGDDALSCRDHVRSRAGLPSFAPAERSAGPSVVAEYVYRLADGSPYLRVRRTDTKAFWQSHWTGAEWVKGKPAGDPVPYRLPEMLDAIHDTVFVVEGEKDADRLASLGFVATTAPEGAGKWRASLNRWFVDKVVYIIADNDDAGRAHAETVARNLSGCASSVRVIALPGLAPKGDVSDWLDAGGDTAELVDLCQEQPIWAPSPSPAPAKALDYAPLMKGPAKGLRHAYLGDVETMPAKKPWMIKGVLAKGETSAWIAPPKGGKSTLVVDLAIAVASGRDWRGYQNRGASGVLSCALERASDVKRMMLAHKKRNGFGALPIAIADEIVDMMDPGCVELIVTTIRECSTNLGTEIGLLVIDTFAKGIAAGGGDEDKARDQGKVFANLQRIKEQTGVHVLIIGHTGKDAERGARGSNALLGDVDLMVEISGDDIRRATVTGANDRDTGLVTAFRIEPFVLGHDEDGDPITTRIIDPELISEDELATTSHAENAERPLPRHLEAFRDAWRDSYDNAVTGSVTASRVMGDGPKVKMVKLSVVRDNFRKRFVTGEADPAKASQNERQAFRRALARLGAITLASGQWDGHEWVWSIDSRDNRDSTVTPLVTPSVTHPVTGRTSRDRRDRNNPPSIEGGVLSRCHGHGDGSDKREADDAERS